MTTRQDTKSSMTKDAAIASTTYLLKKIKYPKAEETAKALIEKYGVAGYDMTVAAMVEPYVVTKKLGIDGRSSRAVITYLNTKSVTDEQATKIAGKKVTVKGGTKQTQKTTQQKKPAPTTQKREAEKKVDKKVAEAEAKKKKAAEAKKKEEEAKKKAEEAKKEAYRPSPLKPEKSTAQQNPWMNSQPNIKSQFDFPTVEVHSKTRTEKYNELSQNGKQDMDLDTLMKECGITAADVQKVLSKKPSLLSKVQPGKTTQKITKNANAQGYNGTGGCLGGVQGIMDKSGINIGATSSVWNNIPKRGDEKSNAGCDTYRALENTGKYVTVTYPSSRTMEVIANMKPGTTLSVDSAMSLDQSRAARSSGGGKAFGHVVVKRSDGKLACDFVQDPSNVERSLKCGNYGDYAHVSIAKDDKLPKELVDLLIKEAEKREKDEQKRVGVLYNPYRGR